MAGPEGGMCWNESGRRKAFRHHTDLYCGGVDTTPSIDKLTHMVHSLHRWLDSPAQASSKDPFSSSSLLLDVDVGVSSAGTLPYQICGTAKSIFLSRACCCCYSLAMFRPPSQ